jgi:Site-specific recombinase XerD
VAKGSIEKRGEFTWRLRVDLGLNADGSRNRPSTPHEIDDPGLMKLSAKCSKYSEAPKKLKEYLDDKLGDFKRKVLSGNYIAPSKLTFKEFYENAWIPKYAKIELKKGATFKSHCSKINNHVLPKFGHMVIEDITTMMLVDHFANLRKPGARIDKRGNKTTLSSRTIQYTYDVTMSVFRRAVEWGLLTDNPLEGLKRPQISKEDKKARKDRMNYYEEDEATEIINALLVTESVWRMYFLGAIIGAFRRGELLALDEDDCDFANNRLRVDEGISDTEDGVATIADTKNEASDAYVDMSEWYMNELSAHIKANRKLKLHLKAEGKWEGGDRNFVFHSGTGKPYYHTTPTQRWKDWCEKNGFRYVTLHGLRHTNATYLLGQGASIKDIQHRLRHSTPQVTSQTYTHVTKKLSRQTASHFDKFDPTVRPQSVPNDKNGAQSS